MRLVKLNIVIAAYSSCSTKQSLLPCRFTSPIVYFKSRKLDSIPQRKWYSSRISSSVNAFGKEVAIVSNTPVSNWNRTILRHMGQGLGKSQRPRRVLLPSLLFFGTCRKICFFCLSSFVCVVLTVKWISVSSSNIGRRATSLIAERLFFMRIRKSRFSFSARWANRLQDSKPLSPIISAFSLNVLRLTSSINAPISSFCGSGCITASRYTLFSMSYNGVKCSWLYPLGAPECTTKLSDFGFRGIETAVPSTAKSRNPRNVSRSTHSPLNSMKISRNTLTGICARRCERAEADTSHPALWSSLARDPPSAPIIS